MFRKTLFWMHLVAGVSAGAVVLIMSVTGVALTYQKQMTEWADRAYWPPEASEGTPLLSFADLIEHVETTKPDSGPFAIRLYSNPQAPAVVSVSEGPIFVNRYSGEIRTGRSESIRRFFRVMTEWHRWLGDDSRSWGRAVTGASNLAFLFIVLSGMVLWIPRRWSLESVRAVTWFKRGVGGKARDFNWHNVFGFWTAIPLALVVASGAVISYPWASRLVYTIAGSEAPVRGRGPSGAARDADGDADLALGDIEQLIQVAATAVPSWRTIQFDIPAGETSRVSFAIDASFGGQPQSRSTVVVDRHSRTIAGRSTFADQDPGQRARSWLRFVHTGEYYGVVGQTVAGIASLAGVFLVYTGSSLSIRRLTVWLGRRRRSPRRSRRSVRPTVI